MRALVFPLALIWTAPALAQAWPSAEANQYWPLKQARIAAYRVHDRAFFERLLSDAFVTIDPGGHRLNRQQYLDAEFPPERASGTSTETEVTDSRRRAQATLW